MSFVTSYTGGPPSGVTIQFVDQITTSPTVRLDLHNTLPFMVTGWNISPPPIRRATSSTMLADGDLITAARHGNKQITLDLELSSAAGPDAASAALQQLGVELNRETNLLRIVLGSHTTFYRVWRSPDYKLDMLDLDGELWSASLTLECEPYGIGLPVVALAATALSSDPASAGRYVDIAGVIGDVETPPQIAFQTTAPSPSQPRTWGTTVFSVRRRGNPANVTHVLQAETGYFYGADTTVATSHDTAMSGAGNNYARATFATASFLFERVDFQFPSFASTDARGAYRLLVRVRTTSTSVYQMQGSYGALNLAKGTVTLPALSGTFLIDLGVVTVPKGNDPRQNGYSGADVAVSPDVLRIQAARVSGTAPLDIDYALLIPADDHWCAVTWTDFDPVAAPWGVIDGPTNSVYQVVDPNASPVVLASSMHSFTGELPMLSPGNNRLYVAGPVSDMTAAALIESVSGSSTLQVKYWPRYLTLATT